jgi:hypothetical protein
MIAIDIFYAGQPFANVYLTHATGPGLQIVSGRLNFERGLYFDPESGVQPWVMLAGGDSLRLRVPGLLPWITFGCVKGG